MKTKLFSLAGIAMLFFLGSCSNDDSAPNQFVIQNPEITGYKITSNTTHPGNADLPTILSMTIGNVQDGKLVSATRENIIDGVSQGSQTILAFTFSNNLVTKREAEGDIKDFFYDANRNLIAINWHRAAGDDNYYRFVNATPAIVYIEKLTLPYDNALAQIARRSIVEFNAHDQIIRAGRDFNLDGVNDDESHFEYTSDNVTAIHLNDGTVNTYTYSPVYENFQLLMEQTLGKRVQWLLDSETFSFQPAKSVAFSHKVSSEEYSSATYELAGEYYTKKTKTTSDVGAGIENTTVTEFFFN